MKRYWPLVVIVIISIIGGAALLNMSPNHSSKYLMVNISGLFFLFLATLKFWDLKGFYEGFSQYDLVAKKSALYGYLYPFLELVVAVGYLSHFFVIGVAILTAILMFITLLGVVCAIFSGREIRCACMGSKLDVPLSVVSAVETLGMGAMAVLIFLRSL